ncbi:MAG TPA: flagellar protein FlgN [Bacteroidota bacterium]|nr:flagellar protein FlgN [Bacteroidota bacterium]
MLSQNVNIMPDAAVEGTLKCLLDSLVDVLWKEVEVHQELREAVAQERKVIMKPSLEALHESNSRKETCILKTRLLEEVRTGLVGRIASHLGLDAAEISLSGLLSHASPEQRKHMVECQTVLRVLVAEIAGMNNQNGLLIESSIRFNESAVNFIANMMCSGSTYAESGQIRTDGLNGRICSQRG